MGEGALGLSIQPSCDFTSSVVHSWALPYICHSESSFTAFLGWKTLFPSSQHLLLVQTLFGILLGRPGPSFTAVGRIYIYILYKYINFICIYKYVYIFMFLCKYFYFFKLVIRSRLPRFKFWL